MTQEGNARKLYVLVGLTRRLEPGGTLADDPSARRFGTFTSFEAAQAYATSGAIPPEYPLFGIIEEHGRFYVCVSDVYDDHQMKYMAQRVHSSWVPKVLYGPFAETEEAEQMALFADRNVWKGVIVCALSDEMAQKAGKVETAGR